MIRPLLARLVSRLALLTLPKEATMWRVARSLDVLLGEINAAAPNRSKISDGSIGDAAHASRDSDHNPWVTLRGEGIVRARDFTHDPAGGLDCNQLAERLAAVISAGAHPAARSGAYVIWQRRILSFDRRGEGWRPYSGSNPHDHHCHLSVATDPGGFDSTHPWGVMAAPKPTQEDDDMASFLDEPINVRNPKGRAETQDVTGRELFTALTIFLDSQPGPHRDYLEKARESKAGGE